MARHKFLYLWILIAVLAFGLSACELPSPSVGDVQELGGGDAAVVDEGAGDTAGDQSADEAADEAADQQDTAAEGAEGDATTEDTQSEGDSTEDSADSSDGEGEAADGSESTDGEMAEGEDEQMAESDGEDASEDSPRPQDDDQAAEEGSETTEGEGETTEDGGEATEGESEDAADATDGEGEATEGESEDAADSSDGEGEAAEGESQEATDSTQGEGTGQTHTVAAGENLYRIGLQYNISWTTLAAFNNITNPASLQAGQVINIPTEEQQETPDPTVTPTPTDETVYIVKPGDNLFLIGLQYGLDWTQIAEANGLVNPNYIEAGQALKIPANQPGSSPEFTHIVAPGDTLFLISLRYGVTWDAIAEKNEIEAPYVILPGQPLVIPAGTGS